MLDSSFRYLPRTLSYNSNGKGYAQSGSSVPPLTGPIELTWTRLADGVGSFPRILFVWHSSLIFRPRCLK